MKVAAASTAKNAGSNRPLTAFEVYRKGLSPAPKKPQKKAGGRIEKKKKSQKEKKIKKATLLTTKTSTPKKRKTKPNPNNISMVKIDIENDNIDSGKENVSNNAQGKNKSDHRPNHKQAKKSDVANGMQSVKQANKKKDTKFNPSQTKALNGKIGNAKNKKKIPKSVEPLGRKIVRAKAQRNNALRDKIKKVKELVNQEIQKKEKIVPHLVELSMEEEQEDDFKAEDLDDSFDSDVTGDDEDYKEDEKEEEASDDEEIVESNEDDDSGDEERIVGLTAYDGEEIGAVNYKNSVKEGQDTFKWIIHPHKESDFFSQYWEKKPLLVKRKKKDYYKGLFSTVDFDKILHEQVVLFTKNLDVTSYTNGKRETHNPIGQAHAPVVWDYYNNGCSLRMLNPQTFHSRVWKCLASLQEYFNSFCGANVYLTPPDTQGFAPHWDDIEAFILQLEGKKRWRVYEPRNDEEVLPESSSPNLDQESIGDPILDTILEPGDLLYFPRGYIHQGHAAENEHSLHITISTYQKNTWGHYIEKLLPHALSVAMAEDVEFRKGLPRDYLDYMGIVHMETESKERTAFREKVSNLVVRMMENAPFDGAADQRGVSFMHDCLPPYLTKEDRACSVYEGGEKWCKKKNKVINRAELQPDTPVRLIRGNCLRLVAEDDTIHIYYNMENSREYHREEPQYLEIALESAPGVEALLHSYPAYVPIESLPLENDEDKMTLASGLWERGLLVTAHPLEATYDD